MSDLTPVWVAAIVAVPTVISPLLIAWQMNRNTAKVKKADYARQDAVAAEAKRAAAKVEAQVTKTADLLVSSNARQDEASNLLLKNVAVIHTLVNSTLTAALEGQLKEARRGLASLIEIVALNQAAGRSASVEALAEIDSARSLIAGLETSLADRSKQNDLANQQLNATPPTAGARA